MLSVLVVVTIYITWGRLLFTSLVGQLALLHCLRRQSVFRLVRGRNLSLVSTPPFYRARRCTILTLVLARWSDPPRTVLGMVTPLTLRSRVSWQSCLNLLLERAGLRRPVTTWEHRVIWWERLEAQRLPLLTTRPTVVIESRTSPRVPFTAVRILVLTLRLARLWWTWQDPQNRLVIITVSRNL